MESWASSQAVRNSMQGNKRRDTSPELRVRRLVHAAGLRYRVDWSLPFDRRRKADLAFTKVRVAVFIDGCFWHGCPDHFVPPKTNIDYWQAKIGGNQSRDSDTTSRLEEAGWTVLRFWEHESAVEVATAIGAMVEQLR